MERREREGEFVAMFPPSIACRFQIGLMIVFFSVLRATFVFAYLSRASAAPLDTDIAVGRPGHHVGLMRGWCAQKKGASTIS